MAAETLNAKLTETFTLNEMDSIGTVKGHGIIPLRDRCGQRPIGFGASGDMNTKLVTYSYRENY